MIAQIIEQIASYFFDNLPQWIFVFVSGVFVSGYRRNKALSKGVEALLRDRIIHSYNKYTTLGYCPIYAKENVHRMYKPYHQLGGNDVATDMVEELEKLPTREEDRQ